MADIWLRKPLKWLNCFKKHLASSLSATILTMPKYATGQDIAQLGEVILYRSEHCGTSASQSEAVRFMLTRSVGQSASN